MSTGKEVATVQGSNVVAFNVGAAEGSLVQDEMDGLQMSIPKVKIPSGGITQFEVPGDDPDSPDMVKELVGVIVHKHPLNMYYQTKFAGGNERPDCVAVDGKHGVGAPGGLCNECPMNAFGSGKDDNGNPTRGKACNNRHNLFILRDGEIVPLKLSIPSTGLKALSTHIQGLVMKGKRSNAVLTRITLKKEKNAGGIDYAAPVFARVGDIPPELAQVISEFGEGIKANIHRDIAAEAEGNVSEDDIAF